MVSAWSMESSRWPLQQPLRRADKKHISNTFFFLLFLILDASAKSPSTTSMQLEGVISIKRKKKQEVEKNILPSPFVYASRILVSAKRAGLWVFHVICCSTEPLLCAVPVRCWQEGCQVAAVSLHASGKCSACLPRPCKRAKFQIEERCAFLLAAGSSAFKTLLRVSVIGF